MVYHFPGTEPIGNSSRLGIIRLLTSDEQAASLIRSALTTAFKYVLVILSCAALLQRYQDHILRCIPISALKLRENIDSWSIELSVASIFILLWACNYLVLLCLKWNHRIKFKAPSSKTFFWTTDDEGNAPAEALEPGAFGILFDKKRIGWFPHPVITVEYALKRAFQTVGLKLLTYLWMDIVAGTEYTLTAAFRYLGHYWGLPQYNQRPDRHQIYLGMVNTALAIHLIVTPGDDNYGHVVIKNCFLPHENATTTRFYSSIVFHLDHAQQTVVRCVATYLNPDGMKQVETYGDPVSANNTYEFSQLSEEEQVNQIGLIASVSIATQNHSLLHWWSNATTLLTAEDWPSVHLANKTTQWVNGLAVWGSPRGAGFTVLTAAKLLSSGANQGYPLHNKLTIVQDGCVYNFSLLSKFHQMSHKTRLALLKFMKENKDERAYQKVDGIIAVTVMHSADHHYTAKYLPIFSPSSNCVLTKTDLSGVNMSFVKPIAYWSWRSLVRQNLSDPINKIIYEVCSNEDPDFAYNWLTLGCTQ